MFIHARRRIGIVGTVPLVDGNAAVPDAAPVAHALIRRIQHAAVLMPPEPSVDRVLREQRRHLLAQLLRWLLIAAEELVMTEQQGLSASRRGELIAKPGGLRLVQRLFFIA